MHTQIYSQAIGVHFLPLAVEPDGIALKICWFLNYMENNLNQLLGRALMQFDSRLAVLLNLKIN